MAEKPILMSTPMVQAILDDRKGQTRRLDGLKDVNENPDIWFPTRIGTLHLGPRKKLVCKYGAVFIHRNQEPGPICRTIARYQPGDILWVRETWCELYVVDALGYTHYDQPMHYYAADGYPDITLYDADGFELDDQRIKWKPSIHMPREVARIFLKITGVRVERVQDITENDAVAEGTTNYLMAGGRQHEEMSMRAQFSMLWDSLNVKRGYGWEVNPWVWVYEFERVEA